MNKNLKNLNQLNRTLKTTLLSVYNDVFFTVKEGKGLFGKVGHRYMFRLSSLFLVLLFFGNLIIFN